jgi:glycosyltransferase involved in cell wall biosynthesis
MDKGSLKILFDAGPLVNGQKSGVGHYTDRLVKALAVNYPNELTLVGHYFNFLDRKRPVLPRYNNVSYRVSRFLPGKALSILRRIGLQIPFDLLIRSRGDIALFPNFVSLPTIQRIKKIVVVHDLIFEDSPEYLQPANRKFLKRFVPSSVKNADLVVAVSENTKKEIIEHYKISPSKIIVVTPAVDHSEFKSMPGQAVQDVTAKFGIKKPYILTVGTLEPRKNLIGVLNAFELLPESIKEKHSLVLVGGKGWLDSEIQHKYEQLNKKYSVVKTGYVEDDDLPALYSGAKVFVYPSFYEGFGIPPLEAMACGAPVITSDNSSLPEVVGSAAIMVKATETRSLADKIEEVLTNKDLADNLSKQGLKQSYKFSWEDSARKLIEALKESSASN